MTACVCCAVLLSAAAPNVSIPIAPGLGVPGLILPTLLGGQNVSNTTTTVTIRDNT